VHCGHGEDGGAGGRRRREVGDAPDRWGPPVGERERGRWSVPADAAGPGRRMGRGVGVLDWQPTKGSTRGR
jgi:hypothetical protein